MSIKERAEQVRLAKESPSHCFYVYVHKRLSDHTPFYVGKGKANRAWRHSCRSTYWKSTVRKHGYIVEIIAKELEEKEAFSLESKQISDLREAGYKLCNHTDGGEGMSGCKWTDKSREKYKASITSRVVFMHMKKVLTGVPLLSCKAIERILGVDTGKLPQHVKTVKHRNKPSWNSGKPSPTTKGINNSSADKQVYTFVRQSDDLVFIGTRYELCEVFSLNVAQIGKLFYKISRDISQGWCLLKGNNGN